MEPGAGVNSERRKYVNTLAVEAKTSQTAVQQLWVEVEGLIISTCQHYIVSSGYDGLEFEDFFHGSYFGFLKAVSAYDIGRGSFSTILPLYVRNSCRDELKQYLRNRHVSFDAPHGEDGDTTLLDILPDPTAGESYEMVLLRSVVKVILDEADRLPNPVQTRIVRECLYWGRSLKQLGDELGVSRQALFILRGKAVRYLRKRPTVQAIGREYFRAENAAKREAAISPYRAKGLSSFKSDFTSVVESIVINRLHGVSGNERKPVDL